MRAPQPRDDAAGYRQLYSNPAIYRYVGDTHIRTIQDAEQELARLLSISTISLWVIFNMDNEILGRYFLNLDQRLLERVTGEGNRIRPDYWRRGVNRAARRLMFTYAFTELGANAYETAISAFSVLSITRVSRTRYLSLINQHLIYLENRNYKAYFPLIEKVSS